MFVIIVLPIIVLCIGGYFGYNYFYEKNNMLKEKDIVKKITSHYNEYVKTNDEVKIYDKNGNEIGLIGKDVELNLDEIEITSDTKYFKIKDFDDEYYVKYQDVDKIDALTLYSDRYKSYILFNENIVTNDKISFYDENNNLVYTFNKSFDLPIIIKDDNRYGIEFNNRLLYVKKDEIKETKENNNTELKNANGVPVLNYHFAYEDDDKTCNQVICHSASQLKEHFSYIKDNNFFTPTMKELEMYIDKKLQLPQKSVVITFDDGWRADVARKYVDEYKINATLFLITSWYDKE